MKANKEILFSLTLVATGIKKKCRKVDTHIFRLGEIPHQEVTDALKEKIRYTAKSVLDKKMRVSSQAKVNLEFSEADPITGGMLVHMCSPNKNYTVQVSP